ncbi:MAG: hypothetical protein KHY89_04440 [Butyricicoccus pullicaecorum]|nr:hypothetical protein [Butyricicoccus pullicaecorum]
MNGLHVSGVRAYTEQKRYHRVVKQTENHVQKHSDYDQYRVDTKGEPAPGQAQTVQQVAEALRKQYSWVSFTFADLGDSSENLAQFAVSAGKGLHLVISPEILEWMAQGGTAWQEGSEMIGKTIYELMKQTDANIHNSGAVIAADGQTTLWYSKWENPKSDMEQDLEYMKNMLDRLDKIRKQNAEQQKKMRLLQKKKLNYQMGKDMSRLARGTTDRDVRSLISGMYANRQRIATSRTYSKKEIQMTLAQIDHVIRCARTKIRQLKEEGQMQQRVEKAEKEREEKLKRELIRELKERKRKRLSKEHAQIFERIPELPGLRDREEQREAQMQAAAVCVGSPTAAAPAVLPAGGETSGGTTVTVSVSGGSTVEVSMVPMA